MAYQWFGLISDALIVSGTLFSGVGVIKDIVGELIVYQTGLIAASLAMLYLAFAAELMSSLQQTNSRLYGFLLLVAYNL